MVQWYPGHIAKAEKALREQLSAVDMVLEVGQTAGQHREHCALPRSSVDGALRAPLQALEAALMVRTASRAVHRAAGAGSACLRRRLATTYAPPAGGGAPDAQPSVPAL